MVFDTISEKKTNKKNIIFDLGAVLIDWNPKKIIADNFKDKLVAEKLLLNILKSSVWNDLDKGLLTPVQVVDVLSDKFDRDMILHFINSVPEYLTPLQDGLNILQKVKQKGYKTYILSNMSEYCHKKIIEYDFLKNFDGGIFSYQVNLCKPELAIYKKLLETYKLKPEESLFIDDMEINIKVAHDEVGIDGIVCSSHEFVSKELKRLNIL